MAVKSAADKEMDATEKALRDRFNALTSKLEDHDSNTAALRKQVDDLLAESQAIDKQLEPLTPAIVTANEERAAISNERAKVARALPNNRGTSDNRET